MLLVVNIDVSALAGTKMSMRAFCARIEPYRCPSLAVRACVRACSPVTSMNVQVPDGSAEDPVVLLCPHLLHRVADSGRRGGRVTAASIVDVDASVVHACTHRFAAKKLLMNAFCRTGWELPISLSQNFSKLVSAAMSLPLIALRWPPFPSSRACAWP